MRIPITMCHGICRTGDKPLTTELLGTLMKIAADMGFRSINYNDLEAWRKGAGTLPDKPIMLDFDHPVKSMRYEVREILDRYGFKGNLFVNTAPVTDLHAKAKRPGDEQEFMAWDEIGELVKAGWLIGAHTVNHPNLSELSHEDPTGEIIRREFDENNATLQKHLGITPKDLAFTGTSWSSAAEQEAMKRYRFGRLWIIGSKYNVDGREMRYAELVGVDGDDEPDGGPPEGARYITKDTPAYRLPSMEIQALIHEPEAFRRYLENSL